MTNLPVAALAQIVRSKGRGRDTILAHITPREAKKLKREGGRGSINPDTGLLEFEDGFDFFSGPTDVGSFSEPAAGQFTQNQPQYIYNEPAGPAYEPSATGGATLGYYTPQDFGTYPQQGDLATAYQTLAADPAMRGSYIPTEMQATFPRQDMTDISALPVARPSFIDAASLRAGGEPSEITPPEGSTAQDELSKRVAELEKAKATATPAEKSFLDKLTADPLKLALALGAGGMGLYTGIAGRKQAADVANQIKGLAQEQRTMAQPYLQQGGLAFGLGTQGALTPANQQQFDVARAQLAQAAARTGSVGAMQATQIADQIRQQAINNQVTQALQMLGSGNTVMNSAIQNEIAALNSRVSLTNQANQAYGNFFQTLGNLYGATKG
jgi:hypothetical protein